MSDVVSVYHAGFYPARHHAAIQFPNLSNITQIRCTRHQGRKALSILILSSVTLNLATCVPPLIHIRQPQVTYAHSTHGLHFRTRNNVELVLIRILAGDSSDKHFASELATDHVPENLTLAAELCDGVDFDNFDDYSDSTRHEVSCSSYAM